MKEKRAEGEGVSRREDTGFHREEKSLGGSRRVIRFPASVEIAEGTDEGFTRERPPEGSGEGWQNLGKQRETGRKRSGDGTEGCGNQTGQDSKVVVRVGRHTSKGLGSSHDVNIEELSFGEGDTHGNDNVGSGRMEGKV